MDYHPRTLGGMLQTLPNARVPLRDRSDTMTYALRTSGLVAALFLAFATTPATADTVELFDGTKIETTSITFADGKIVLADGRTFDRNDVRRVFVGTERAVTGDRAPLMAGADVQDLLRTADAAREQYPDVGAITLIDHGDWTWRKDGTQVRRTHAAHLIMKEPWKSLGQISEFYEEGRERATLVRARTIAPDGTVTEFDPADLKESKPAGSFVFFNEYKTVSGQLPQVEVGSIVEAIWEVETHNPYDENLFFPRWYFGSTEPVLSSKATVRVPQGRELHYRADNFVGGSEPTKRTEGDYDVYEWALEDIEHIVSEPGMPPVGEVVPSVAASPFESWDYIYDFLGKFQKEHTEVTPEIEAQVAEIIGDTTDPEEKIAKIYHWLQREVRYISIKGSLGSGWSGHPATLTLKNKYGDCIDKATLFATMLKACDIKAEPVILATYGLPEDDCELPTMFGNHAITEVHLNGRDFHLDCTGTSFRYPYFVLVNHGVKTINVLDRRIGQVEVPPADQNALDVHMKMRLESDGTLKAIVKLDMNGSVEGIMRQILEQINAMLRKMVAQQAINSLSPGAELISIDVTDEADLDTPLKVTLKIKLPEYPTEAGDLLIFEMPLAKLVKSIGALTALDEREFDILSPSTMCLRQHIELQLPKGYEPKGLPEPVEFSTDHTTYTASYRFEDGKIFFNDDLRLNERRIPADAYSALKQKLENFGDFVKLPLFLTKAG